MDSHVVSPDDLCCALTDAANIRLAFVYTFDMVFQPESLIEYCRAVIEVARMLSSRHNDGLVNLMDWFEGDIVFEGYPVTLTGRFLVCEQQLRSK
jgi:hypothetical protein